MYCGLTVLIVLIGLGICQEIPGSGQLRKAFSVKQFTSVQDDNDKEVARRDVKLTVYGKCNRTSDGDVLQGLVQKKLAFIQSQPVEDEVDLWSFVGGLPLRANVTATEIIQLGPRPKRNLAICLSVQVYSRKKCEPALDAVDFTIVPA